MNFLFSLLSKFQKWKYERKCVKYFGTKPETIYLSQRDYDALLEQLNSPSDPKQIESLNKLMERVPPWGKND